LPLLAASAGAGLDEYYKEEEGREWAVAAEGEEYAKARVRALRACVACVHEHV